MLSSTPSSKLSWKVMLVAFPLIAVAQVLATFQLNGPLGSSVSALAAFAAGYLGMHTEAPGWLVSRPQVSSLLVLAKAGLIVKLGLLLPFVPDPWLQVGLWLVIALLAYLAGVPLTVGSSGAALPVAVSDPPRGVGELRFLGALVIAVLAALGGAAWADGAHWLAVGLLLLAILSAGANALALLFLGTSSARPRRPEPTR